jgi:hypothetical protein
MSTPRQHHAWNELAVRENDGLTVSLLWNRDTGRVKVAVADAHLDQQFELDISGEHALAAFHHPFAYAADPGISSSGAGSHHGPRPAPERSTVS